MEDLQEFETLASSAGVEAMQVITGSRKAPHPKYFVGEGKAVEIAEAVKAKTWLPGVEKQHWPYSASSLSCCGAEEPCALPPW